MSPNTQTAHNGDKRWRANIVNFSRAGLDVESVVPNF
jgi:hypothetical protein